MGGKKTLSRHQLLEHSALPASTSPAMATRAPLQVAQAWMFEVPPPWLTMKEWRENYQMYLEDARLQARDEDRSWDWTKHAKRAKLTPVELYRDDRLEFIMASEEQPQSK